MQGLQKIGYRRGGTAAMLLVTLALLGACEKKEEAAAPVIRPVRTITAEVQQEASGIALTGEIKARQESAHGFRIGGQVVARLVDVGDTVKKDQPLARIDDRDQKNQIRAAQAAVTAARAEVERAKPQEERQRQLLASGYTTQVQYDNALKLLRSAEANLESASSSLKLAQDQLKYTVLAAEFDGVVTATGVEAGQVVQAGQMVVVVADPDQREAVVGVPETRMRTVPPDFRVDVELVSNPAIKTTGKLREVSPIADPVTRSFTVKVSLDNPPPEMRLGSTIRASGSGQVANTVSLPPSAVFERDKKPMVWVVNPADKTVAMKPIVVLRNDTDRIIVSEGIASGDIVVTAGVMKLSPGQKVALQAPAAK
ncbi:MAG: efflux RND transporter periplasmic adaptor subunit [Alphaproteobacteria bacterium]|nr:efflux RND transporter periplasmic adaptor subunit [Alphaproteobacteria bacterium]